MTFDGTTVGDTNLNQQGSDTQNDVNESVQKELFSNMNESDTKSFQSSDSNASNDSYMQDQGFPSVAGCTS